jgi:uncharacterized protein (TIGR01777 family)
MTKRILITGASGLVGTRLTELLTQKGYTVAHLGRAKHKSTVPSYVWNVEAGSIDPEALVNTDVIIHLAGANVAEKRWTASRKKEIIESRTLSSALLCRALQQQANTIRTVISASAIGYYGFEGSNVFTESSPAGTDFLANVTRQWENEINSIESPHVRLVKLRIGVVLSAQGGVVTELSKPIRWGLGAPLGSGNQYISWIHIDDLCAMFIKAIEDDNMTGAYNAVTDWITNRELTRAIAHVLHKPLWLPAVPAFVLRAALGEMADIVLMGSKVSPAKIEQAGFHFQYTKIEGALSSLLPEKASRP